MSLLERLHQLLPFRDARRYQAIRARAAAHSKKGGLVLNKSSLTAHASFHYWCKPEELDALLDALP